MKHVLPSFTKYIVLSSPRSGTNHLIHLLGSHPAIRSFGELFQPDFLLGNPTPTLLEHPLVFHVFKRYRSKYPVFLLHHFIYRRHYSRMKSVGFKIFYDHAKSEQLAYVWDYLARKKDLKIIHMIRKNSLKALVSFTIAKQTHEFITFTKSQEHTNLRIHLEFEECIRYFRQAQVWQKYYADFFGSHAIHRVLYEDLLQDEQKETTAIQRFLGVPVIKLSSPVEKQNYRSLRDIISNYTTLRSRFARTEYADFFT